MFKGWRSVLCSIVASAGVLALSVDATARQHPAGGSNRTVKPTSRHGPPSPPPRLEGTHHLVVRVVEPNAAQVLGTSLTVRAPTPPSEQRRVRDSRAIVARTSAPRARLAADPGVTIVDFRFSPATTTIHVGDTLTWSNDGPSPHTATARDGSFDTGILNKGQSGSHTFNQPGTFTYFCTVHPFMHGTVVVLAAANTPGQSTGTSSSQSSPTAAAANTPPSAQTPARTQGAGTLPLTGVNLLAVVATGLLLIASGLLLRRALRSKADGEDTASPEPS